jgi:hypothetical protein
VRTKVLIFTRLVWNENRLSASHAPQKGRLTQPRRDRTPLPEAVVSLSEPISIIKLATCSLHARGDKRCDEGLCTSSPGACAALLVKQLGFRRFFSGIFRGLKAYD